MPNTSRPAGLIPYRHMAGGIPMRINSYNIITAQTGNLFQGDPVVLNAAAATANAGRQISISGITTASLVLGSFIGCRFTAADGSIVYSNKWVSATAMAAGAVGEALVCDDPDMLFQIQVDGAGLLVTQIGLSGVFTLGAGNPLTGVSGVTLNGTTLATGAGQVQIVDILNAPDNDYGVSAKAIVRIINHQYRSTAGV